MEQETTTPSMSAKFAGALVLVLAGLITAGAYGLHERSAVQKLSSRNDQMATAVEQMRTEIASLKTQVAAKPLPGPTAPSAPPVRRVKVASHLVPHKRADDPRWKRMQSQLDQQREQIESTRQDLTNARTELQGSIAGTHDELVVLEKKGERSYYEFDLDKAKQFSHEGPIGIRLRKANTKHQYADVELMVDDTALAQKHVNLLQPVVFYAAEGGRPVELVINKVAKNHIHGYVSEPKYKSSELAATAPNSAAGPAAVPGASAQPRRRLELPK